MTAWLSQRRVWRRGRVLGGFGAAQQRGRQTSSSISATSSYICQPSLGGRPMCLSHSQAVKRGESNREGFADLSRFVSRAGHAGLSGCRVRPSVWASSGRQARSGRNGRPKRGNGPLHHGRRAGVGPRGRIPLVERRVPGRQGGPVGDRLVDHIQVTGRDRGDQPERRGRGLGVGRDVHAGQDLDARGHRDARPHAGQGADVSPGLDSSSVDQGARADVSRLGLRAEGADLAITPDRRPREDRHRVADPHAGQTRNAVRVGDDLGVVLDRGSAADLDVTGRGVQSCIRGDVVLRPDRLPVAGEDVDGRVDERRGTGRRGERQDRRIRPGRVVAGRQSQRLVNL